jgi:uncharacterized membrane protein YgcG
MFRHTLFTLMIPAAVLLGTHSASAESRLALVIGQSAYRSVPALPNPANDARAVTQLLTDSGFEVSTAADLSQGQMREAVSDFAGKVAAKGADTVALVFYAGHGLQIDGENFLVPVDVDPKREADIPLQAVRLNDVLNTLNAVPSRARIILLDACRNNPFPEVNDTGRGLAIVDAPRGSIVGYSTAPGMEAQDGDGNHSPYTSAFLNSARVPNLPIEQLFKRVRLEVNNTTNGRQTPWESSSLTSDFYFFGDTAVAAGRAPDRRPIMQAASNLPSRSVRQAYDYVLSEGSPEYYEEFIRLYPHDPLCDHVRVLLGNLQVAKAWHKAVLANSPFAYKTFHDNYSNSQYAKSALKLQGAPKAVHLMQFTHLAKQSPSFKPGNFGHTPTLGISKGNLGAQAHMPSSSKIVTLPAKGGINPANIGNNGKVGKATTLPGKINTPVNAGKNSGNTGRVTTMPGRFNNNSARLTNRPMVNTAPRRFNSGMGGGFNQRFAASPSRSSFARSSFGGGSFGGGSFGGRGGGFRR